jgi:putative transcriptional regulator
MGESVRGQLLIAAPQLQDYFRRSVVLVLEHNDDGAMGLVLNRPTETAVADALPELADLTDDGLVHAGGPVQPEAVLVLGDFDDPAQAGTPVIHTLGLLDPEQPEPELHRARVFAGYAGWAPGQLDAELEDEAWITAEVTPDDPFLDGDLWPEVLQRKGGGFALLSTMPEDPTLN